MPTRVTHTPRVHVDVLLRLLYTIIMIVVRSMIYFPWLYDIIVIVAFYRIYNIVYRSRRIGIVLRSFSDTTRENKTVDTGTQ